LTTKDKIKTVLKLLSEPKVLYSLVSFRSFGYLLETGWFESFKSGEPVDADLKPIPWFAYSAIDLLKERLNDSLSLLEFGSGNSTLFFAERTKKIISLEHNKNWHQKISSKLPENVELIYTSSATEKEYLQPLVENNLKFDVIIIDGIYRNECIMNSINHLSERGVIILDDSERQDYKAGTKFLIDSGFKQLSFSGIAPGIFFRKCTSIFYRVNNCLSL